jgi:hypothetical protein
MTFTVTLRNSMNMYARVQAQMKFITGQNEREESTQIQPLPKVLRMPGRRKL